MNESPPPSALADADLVRELLWRQRSGRAQGARYAAVAAEHARRIREAPDEDARSALVAPLACGLADAGRPDWVS